MVVGRLIAAVFLVASASLAFGQTDQDALARARQQLRDRLGQTENAPRTPSLEFNSKIESPARNVALAALARMCGLRSEYWFQAFQIAYQKFSIKEANRLRLSREDLTKSDEVTTKIYKDIMTSVKCDGLRNSPIMDALDEIHRDITGNYH